MRDLGMWLKSFAIGLEMMAKGIHSIAKTMYDMANSEKPKSTQRAEKTELNTEKPATKKSRKKVSEISKAQEPEEPVKAKPPLKKAAKKTLGTVKLETPEEPAVAKKVIQKKLNPTPKKLTKRIKSKGKMPTPATEKVYNVIKQSKKSVDNAAIIKETGLDRKQVTNALSQLKKTGKVKSVKRGVHKIV